VVSSFLSPLAVVSLFALLTVPFPAAAQAPASGKLKLFIVVDMEGVAGAVTADQLRPDGFEYDRFRQFMTDEALAAVRGAKEAGATEIVVADSHGNGENLLIELFPRDVRIIRSWPRHGGMMGGIDKSFDATVFIGFHAAATSMTGVRAHSFSSAHFTRVALNGREVSEGEVGAAQAGEFGVPVVFVSGDDAAVADMRGRVPNIVTVETKQALGFHSALTLTPQESAERIGAGVKQALSSVKEIKPYVVKAPFVLELSYKHYAPAEYMSYLRNVQRISARTIRFTGKNLTETMDFLDFADSYSADLTP
jgi:D-amino peptidase